MVITSFGKFTNLKNCTEPLDPCKGNDLSRLSKWSIYQSGSNDLNVVLMNDED